ncbi:MAG: hypothetical protein V1836_01975 [Candidatus Aenigmatarchaeota archaeon]
MKTLKITPNKKRIVSIVLFVAMAWLIFNTYFSHTPENDLRALLSLWKSGDFEKSGDYLGIQYWDVVRKFCVETKPQPDACSKMGMDLNITKVEYNNQTDATITADVIKTENNKTYLDPANTFRMQKIGDIWKLYDSYAPSNYAVHAT